MTLFSSISSNVSSATGGQPYSSQPLPKNQCNCKGPAEDAFLQTFREYFFGLSSSSSFSFNRQLALGGAGAGPGSPRSIQKIQKTTQVYTQRNCSNPFQTVQLTAVIPNITVDLQKFTISEALNQAARSYVNSYNQANRLSDNILRSKVSKNSEFYRTKFVTEKALPNLRATRILS